MGLGGGDMDGGGGVFDESPESLRKSMLKAVRDAMRDEFAPAMQPSFQVSVMYESIVATDPYRV
jgi:hypothetical protein